MFKKFSSDIILQEVFFFVKEFRQIFTIIFEKYSFSCIWTSMIGKTIKELRMERKISQETLAKAIGVSQKAVDFWERGINEPKATYIIRLADHFDGSADILLGRKLY